MRVIPQRLPRPVILIFDEGAFSQPPTFPLDEFFYFPTVPFPIPWSNRVFIEREHDWVTGGAQINNQVSGYYSHIVLSFGRRRVYTIFGDDELNNFPAAPLPGDELFYQPYVAPVQYRASLGPVWPADDDGGTPLLSNLKVEDDQYRPYVPPIVYAFNYLPPYTDELIPPVTPLGIDEDWYIPGSILSSLVAPAGTPPAAFLLSSTSSPFDEPYLPPFVAFGVTGFCAKYNTGAIYDTGKRYCDPTQQYSQYVSDPPLLGLGGWSNEQWGDSPWGSSPNTTTQSFLNVQRLSVLVQQSGGVFILAAIRPILEYGGIYPWNYESFADQRRIQRLSIVVRHSDGTLFQLNKIRPIAEILPQEPIG